MTADSAAIRSGLEAGEFFLEYLPIVALATGRCIGCEALARWRRSGEVVMPADFIPVIEGTPISGLFTYWVVETVAREMGDFMRSQDDIVVGINIPPEILGRGGLAYAIDKAGLMDCTHKMIFEITERGLPDELGVQALNLAQEAGVRIAIDDTSLRGGNLVVLARISATDMVKIDKSVIDRLSADSGWWPSLAALAASSRAPIVAEGVETATQATALRLAGVPLAQGFLFSRPLPADELREFYLAHR